MPFLGFDFTTKPIYGSFILKDLNESFHPSFRVWSVNDYQQHWKKNLKKVLTGKNTSLIVNWNPVSGETGFSGEMWEVFHLEKDKYALQNCLILNENYPDGKINPNKLEPFPRETIDEDGEKISEWETTRAEILDLLKTL